MKSPAKSKLRKVVYKGDPLAQPPPAELSAILDRYRGERDALITVLAEIQRHYGYLGQDQLGYVARELGFPIARVYGVATFYNLFLFDPPGEFQVRVCRGTACHVNHSLNILKTLSKHLDIAIDETTPDGKFTLQTVALITEGIVKASIFAVNLCGGYVHRIQGDGLMVYFGGKNIEKKQATKDALKAFALISYFVKNDQ